MLNTVIYLLFNEVSFRLSSHTRKHKASEIATVDDEPQRPQGFRQTSGEIINEKLFIKWKFKLTNLVKLKFFLISKSHH